MDPRPVCKVEFWRCGPVEKKLECSICLGLVVAARQSRVGSKFPYINILIFYLSLKILQQIKDSIPNFLTQHLEHPISVHMQKNGPKLTELEPFSWMRSKFAIFDEDIFNILAEILISAVQAQFWSDRPHFFSAA